MFRIGAKVAYPGHGVGVVEALEKHTIHGSECRFFVVHLLGSKQRFLIPASQVTSEVLRPPLSRAAISKVYHILRTPKPLGSQASWLRRSRSYPEKIKSGTLVETAKILRELLARKTMQTLSLRENEMLLTAHDRLVKELAHERANAKAKLVEELSTMLLLATSKNAMPDRS